MDPDEEQEPDDEDDELAADREYIEKHGIEAFYGVNITD